MGDPGYDFFATGGAATATPSATPDGEQLPAETRAYGASVNRFGSPVALEGQTAAAPNAAPSPAPVATDNPAYAAAYSVEVNRFGSPVTLEGAAPATPILAVPAPVPPPLATPGFNPDVPLNRFGGPAVPADVPLTVPVASSLVPQAPPSAAPAPFPVPAAAGYTPGAVNHFGTPLAASGAPTGPYAAPGIGAMPVAAPGMVSSWDPRAGVSTSRARASARPSLPQGVRTAGIIGVIEGALLAVASLFSLLGYLSLKSNLAELSAATGSSAFSATISSAVLIGVVVLFLSTALYLAAGVGTIQGRRWAAWVLLVVSGLNVLWALYGFVDGSSGGVTTLLGLLISGSVVVMLLSNEPRRWLMAG